jgi:hypothetical protein
MLQANIFHVQFPDSGTLNAVSNVVQQGGAPRPSKLRFPLGPPRKIDVKGRGICDAILLLFFPKNQ